MRKWERLVTSDPRRAERTVHGPAQFLENESPGIKALPMVEHTAGYRVVIERLVRDRLYKNSLRGATGTLMIAVHVNGSGRHRLALGSVKDH